MPDESSNRRSAEAMQTALRGLMRDFSPAFTRAINSEGLAAADAALRVYTHLNSAMIALDEMPPEFIDLQG